MTRKRAFQKSDKAETVSSKGHFWGRIQKFGELTADIGARIAEYILFIFAMVLLLMNLFCLSSFLFNTETVVYTVGLSVLKLFFCLGFIVSLYLFYYFKVLEKVPLNLLRKGLFAFIIITSIFWIFMAYDVPYADSGIMINASEKFLENDYEYISGANSYFQRYPYQLPFAFYVEQVYRITGPGRHLFLKILNVCYMVGIYGCMIKISNLFLSKETDKKIALILFFTCWQPIFLTTFIYPLTPSLLCIFLAVYHFLKYLYSLQTAKLSTLALSGLYLGLAILFKNNMWISWIALGIVILLLLLKKKDWKILTTVLLSVLVVAVGGNLIRLHYEIRSGIPIGKGTPGIVWVAMGLQKSERAPGWYNGFPPNIMKTANYDSNTASELARESIKDSLGNFAEHPKYALEFFVKKEISQWCEPTWECFFLSSCQREHEKPLNHLTNSIYNGTVHQGLLFLFHSFQILWIFGFACALFPAIRKEKAMEALIFPLAILGGFLCHTFWEGKSQYVFPYYMMMLPCSVRGYIDFFSWIQKKNIERKRAPAIEKQTGVF